MPGFIIFLMNGWDSVAGGIQTVNRELVSAIGRIQTDVSCIVIVPTATREEISDAFSRGVTLISGNRREWDDVLLSAGVQKINPDQVVAVVGHSYFTGREAKNLRDRVFPNALSVQFVHTSPLHVESIKEYKQDSYVKDREEKVAREIDLAVASDLVICIGPRLHRAMHDLISAQNQKVVVRRIDCGLSRRPDPFRRPPIRPTLLCLGRTESIGVKGLDIFAYAAGYLTDTWIRHPSTRERTPPQFVVRGVKGDGEKLETMLANYASEVGMRPTIIVRPYTANRDELAADYRGATVFLMPSREEGFGLVACEALSLGVPTLVSETSGIAEVIKEASITDFMDVSHCVISMQDGPREIAQRFADAALEILVNQERGLTFCNILAERLMPVCSWEAGAQQFLAEVASARRDRRMPEPPHKIQVDQALEARSGHAFTALQDLRSTLDSLPGLISVGIQEAIIVTFEKGHIPPDLPAELNGLPLFAKEGEPIRQTADAAATVGYLLVGGRAVASVCFVQKTDGEDMYALTVAHALQDRSDDKLSVRVGSAIFDASVAEFHLESDLALLSLAHVGRVGSISPVGDPVLGQEVQITVSGTRISGKISSVGLTSAVEGPDGRVIYRDLFEVSTFQDVPLGSSGSLVSSVDGHALGMSIAGTKSDRQGLTQVFAVPMRVIAEAFKIRVFDDKPSSTEMKIGIIPADNASLQEILASVHDSERLATDGRLYFRGRIGSDGSWITITPVPRVGNIGAAVAATALALDNDIRHIFLVGQCSGLDRTKQSMGDVVVASDVIYYEPGIIGSDTEQMRFRVSGTTSKSVLDVARELANGVQGLPPIHIGTIASGEKVVSDSSLFANTISRWSNVAAVEMEGAGVFEAAASTGRNIVVAVVRGISDFVDQPRTDDFRLAASRNAVRVALELIRRLTVR